VRPLKRLANVRECVENVLADNSPGGLIETGVWRGGTTIFMHQSTIQALETIYDKLSADGYVIVDDYGNVAGCRQAVHDFRARRAINDPIQTIDWGGVYWRRTGDK
jgi:hypothetical protein